MLIHSRLRPVGRSSRSLARRSSTAGRAGSVTELLESRRLLSVGASISGPSTAVEGPYVLTLSAPQPLLWNIDWGDGSTSTVDELTSGDQPTATHFFDGTVPATHYSITATVTYTNGSGDVVTEPVGGSGGVDFSGNPLDPSFDGDGLAIVSESDQGFVSDMGVDAAGRIVTVGLASNRWELKRYTPSGQPDGTFDAVPQTGMFIPDDTAIGDGRRRFDLPFTGFDRADAVTFDGNKIIVVGLARTDNGVGSDPRFNDEVAVARFNENGLLDTSFNGTGFRTIPVGAGATGAAVAVQSDGKIVVGARGEFGELEKLSLVRFNGDGSIDSGVAGEDSNPGDQFGSGGIATANFAGDTAAQLLADIALLSDSSGTTTGVIAVGTENAQSVVLGKFDLNGTLDTSFGTLGGGKAGVDLGAGAETAVDVVLQGDHLVVVANVGTGGGQVGLARFTAAGVPDATFGSGGTVLTSTSPFSPTVNNAVLQPDGKIVVGAVLENPDGSGPQASDGGFGVFRYTADGAPDSTYGTSGRSTVILRDFNVAGLSGGGVALLPDGKIIQAGTQPDGGTSATDSDGVLARYGRPSASGGGTVIDVAVTNLPPTDVLITAGAVIPGYPTTFTFTGVDPNPNEFMFYRIDWGDGTPVEEVIAGPVFDTTHVYTSSHTITVQAWDFDQDPSAEAPLVRTLAVSVSSNAAILPDYAHPGETVLAIGGADGGTNGGNNTIGVASLGIGSIVLIDGVPQVFGHADRIVIYGNAGDDRIEFTSWSSTRVEIYGGAGNDRLRGGSRSDVLDGGAGNDLLVGGAGRDLLVGGTGVDKIVGDTDDDILIGGIYTGILDRFAVADVLAEWTSAASYTVRVNHLLNGSGPAGRLNGFSFLSTDAVTIAIDADNTVVLPPTTGDDGAIDILTGSAGQDWFFANTDSIARDKITDLTAAEFLEDVDFITAP